MNSDQQEPNVSRKIVKTPVVLDSVPSSLGQQDIALVTISVPFGEVHFGTFQNETPGPNLFLSFQMQFIRFF
jgi:hypothetical protein